MEHLGAYESWNTGSSLFNHRLHSAHICSALHTGDPINKPPASVPGQGSSPMFQTLLIPSTFTPVIWNRILIYIGSLSSIPIGNQHTQHRTLESILELLPPSMAIITKHVPIYPQLPCEFLPSSSPSYWWLNPILISSPLGHRNGLQAERPASVLYSPATKLLKPQIGLILPFQNFLRISHHLTG